MAGRVTFEAWYDHTADVVRGRWRRPRSVTYAATAMVAIRTADAAEAPLVLSPAPGEADVPEYRWLDGRLWTPNTGAGMTGVAGPHRDASWLLVRLAGGPRGRTTLAGDAEVRRVDADRSAKARADLADWVDGHALIDGMAWEAAERPGLIVRWGENGRRLTFARIPWSDVETYCLADLDLAVDLSGPLAAVPGIVVHRPDLLQAPFVDEAVEHAASKLLTWHPAGAPSDDAEGRLRLARQAARDASARGDRVDLAGLCAALSEAMARPWAARADAEAHRLVRVALDRAARVPTHDDIAAFAP